MKADNLSLLTLLTSNHQYTIPIYQRRYGWNIDQCQ